MLIVSIKGPMASGKTTLTNQLRRMLTQQGVTWREKLAWWLLKRSPWNLVRVRTTDMHVVHHLTPALANNLRNAGVKLVIVDGDMA